MLHKRTGKLRLACAQFAVGFGGVRDERGCTLHQRDIDEAVAVRRTTAHRDKDISGAHTTRVVLHAADLRVFMAGRADDVHLREYVAESHVCKGSNL